MSTPRSLLLVEDDTFVRLALKAVLSEGFEVDTAADVKGALAALTERPVPVVVLDLMLPDGTGRDILRYLREHLPDAVAIVLTGNIEHPEARSIQLGREAFLVLSKSLSPSALIERVEASFRAAAARRDPARAGGAGPKP